MRHWACGENSSVSRVDILGFWELNGQKGLLPGGEVSISGLHMGAGLGLTPTREP